MTMNNSTIINPELLWRKLKFDETEIHCQNFERAIVVFSGGFDSTVALWWTMLHYKYIRLLIVDYNQFHREEIFHAERIANLAGMKYSLIKLDLPPDFWGLNNNLTRGQAGLMTGIAALDIGMDGADIVHGILRTDTYPDCDRNYLDTLTEILSNSMDLGKIGIATPLRAVNNKQAVCILGFLYGAPLKWTWSCRTPQDGKPCGICSPCQNRKRIWEQMVENYGISKDKIEGWQNVLGSPAHPTFRKPPRELYVLIQAFIRMNGLRFSKLGWRYVAPDGKEHFSTWIRNPDAIHFKGRKAGKICNHIEVHGSFGDGSWWQLVVCQDHSIAFTDRLPDVTVIEECLREKLISVIFDEK